MSHIVEPNNPMGTPPTCALQGNTLSWKVSGSPADLDVPNNQHK